ncbi:ABC-type nickel/cobalt efflux system permease component RcnA [Kitasatospora gansuensis]|uniref:ABC-type nickel/cobalt efflux system permease component RcnA n=1 Tax=Kitasatospora gansuensis TaxID=258050 RepID=A0A7W7WG52_9ACTN|nr:high frequency lysogenization protein HflD [Kitasatospora gansuensis]MBB4945270.1 ABC-type nickel/cobalt efflux system permease component RcnA [Kitasatospora gansuensis]
MTPSRFLARAGGTLGAALWLLAGTAPAAAAHPLGNFSVNHYLGLTVHPDRIEVLAVTDQAEIPTLQEQARVDRNADGTVDDAERGDWAAGQCTATATRLQVRAGPADTALNWRVRSASYAYADGAAGLRTARLECTLDAPLTVAADGTVLRVRSGADRARVGWNEITARGVGVRLDPTDVPEVSASHELRDYPQELLDAPSGVFDARFTATPGGGSAAADLLDTAPTGGPAGWLAQLDRRLAELGAAHRLTVTVGLLAVLLATVLGAGHALLPGHGKAAMGVYLAGRRSRVRDAVTVGATVTVTHTAGVLVLGLLLTGFSALAGEVLLGRLGVLSGLLVTAVGVLLLRDVRRRTRPAAPVTHDHPHHHAHPHPHPHDGTVAVLEAPVHHHHGLFGHHHHGEPLGRTGLIGLGVAGGLVPSPSALVVLLGAVALGRTMFGVALVLAYGLGMAATLTAAGLLFLRVGKRIAAAADGTLPALLRRLAPWSGLLTALLVLTVGLGMVLRSLPAAL